MTMDIAQTILETSERNEWATRYATHALWLYGQRILVDSDEGKLVWVTFVPLCPHCLEPVSEDREVCVRIDPDLPWQSLVACYSCESVLGVAEERTDRWDQVGKAPDIDTQLRGHGR